MKHNSPKASVGTQTNAHDPAPQKPLESKDWDPEQEDNDPVWNILGQASNRKPDPFFARNVVRSTRLLENTSETWFSRVTSLFTQRTSRQLALGAAACVCALVTYQIWPSTPSTRVPVTKMAATPPQPSPPATITAPAEIAPTELSELSELVIAETLEAAAENPTIFTHDEVVAMIGF